MFIVGGKINLYSFLLVQSWAIFEDQYFIVLVYTSRILLDDNRSFVFMARLVTVSLAYTTV